MKYYSIAAWAGEVESCDADIRAYEAYISGIASQLPPDLRALATHQISINDSNIASIELSVERSALEIVMYGDVPTHPQQPHGWEIVLRYGSVCQFTSMRDPHGLPGPYGYGDHGFDEVEIIEDGVYEHRMLFSSGIEIAVQFRQFSLTLTPDTPRNR